MEPPPPQLKNTRMINYPPGCTTVVWRCVSSAVTTLNSRGVFRVKRVTAGTSRSARPPHIESMKLIEGHLKIPTHIPTPRVSVMYPKESVYVLLMYRYLAATYEDITTPLAPIIVELAQIRRDSHGVSNPEFSLISWYWNSTRAGRFMFYRDYEALHQSCATGDEHSHTPKEPLETLPEIDKSELPLVPDQMIEKPCHQTSCFRKP